MNSRCGPRVGVPMHTLDVAALAKAGGSPLPAGGPVAKSVLFASGGGPIGLLHDGDRIVIDAEENLLAVEVADEEMAARRAAWAMPPYKETRGTLHKYIKNVASASLGHVV